MLSNDFLKQCILLFRVGISEFCLYWVHPENPEWTCFEQKADLDIKNFFGFEGTAEKLAIKEYSKSIGKSKDIMEHYINVLADEGITRCARCSHNLSSCSP